MKIRPATDADRDAIWNIFHEVVAAGDTYALDPNISREDALAYWFAPGTHTYVAEGDAVGEGDSLPGTPTASLQSPERDNCSAPTSCGLTNRVAGRTSPTQDSWSQRALGGRGLGRAMAEHCLSEARRLGFRAMQFNYVISTNTAAIRLWQDLGFEIVGTLASAFRHPDKGYVDVYVMYRSLL